MAPVGPRKPDEREWLARKHATQRRRPYRKVRPAMDTGTGDIRAVEFTSSRDGDSPVPPDLLHQIPPAEQTGTVTGDGAIDTRRCHTAIPDRGGAAVIPIRRSGPLWTERPPCRPCPHRHPAGDRTGHVRQAGVISQMA